ncbi:MAG: M55 family metallopeptidase [Spirochaetales bacterium]|nr:M55 family metallopeptidase [Spirochaetales bacterium]
MKSILIIADIEGSSGCLSYEASRFKTREWACACYELSKDLDAVVKALFKTGIQRVVIKDFHRTGYNIFRECVDTRAELVSGYLRGPVPGIGSPFGCEGVLFIGMHASSGSEGFLAHTFTSRIEKIVMHGKNIAEVELFASSLFPYEIRPLFFSGGPVACREAAAAITGIETWPIIKNRNLNRNQWREGLAEAAVRSLSNEKTSKFRLKGPYEAILYMKGSEEKIRKLARSWKLPVNKNEIHIKADNFEQFYLMLIRVCYLHPVMEAILPLGLLLFNLYGKAGLRWAKKICKQRGFF